MSKKSAKFAVLLKTTKEVCRSGRTGRSRKPLYPYGYPGFESLSFRPKVDNQPLAKHPSLHPKPQTRVLFSLNKVSYVDFLVLATHAEGKSHLVFDDKLALLQTGNSGADLLEFRAAYAEKVFDNFVVDCLLLHN